MNFKKYLQLISGLILSVIGLILCVSYVTEAYISRIGEPDQSLLFWYLPILFGGIISLAIGLVLSFISVNRLKRKQK